MKIYKSSCSLQSIFEMGKRGLNVQQAQMSITGNNISNVNTEGYTRQRIETTSSSPLQAQYLNVESGAEANTVRRMRDATYDLQIRYENPSLSRWSEENYLLTQVETIMNEPNDMGLSSLMDDFFNSWDNLSQEADSTSARMKVKDSAQTLANTFNNIGQDLTNLKSEINDSISDSITEVNYYIDEISATTQKIMLADEGTSEISTLMDRRDLAIDKLSSLMDIQYEEKSNGDLYVFSGGIILCEGKESNQLLSKTVDAAGNLELYWENENTALKTTNGKIFGLMEVKDSIIPSLESELNTLASTIVNQVNSIHSDNYNLEGNTDIDFFNSTGTTIYDIALDKKILSDVSNISVSDKAGATGNGEGALSISDLQHTKVLDNNTKTIRDYYGGSISKIGNLTKESKSLAAMEESFVNALQTKRNEVKEVNLDEELSNMIKFQQAYAANSKIISTVEQMMTTVIALV